MVSSPPQALTGPCSSSALGGLRCYRPSHDITLIIARLVCIHQLFTRPWHTCPLSAQPYPVAEVHLVEALVEVALGDHRLLRLQGMEVKEGGEQQATAAPDLLSSFHWTRCH